MSLDRDQWEWASRTSHAHGGWQPDGRSPLDELRAASWRQRAAYGLALLVLSLFVWVALSGWLVL